MPDSAQRADKATQILNGALQEFLAQGYAGTSMDRVAATAGVSKPTVYNHFQDKEGLFRALVQRIAQERFQLAFHPEVLQGSARQGLRRLLALILETIAADDEYQAFVRLVIGESGRFPELAHTFVTYLSKPGNQLIRQYLDDHPEINLPDPEYITHIIVGTVVYTLLTQHILHGQEILPICRDRLLDTLMALIIPEPGESACAAS